MSAAMDKRRTLVMNKSPRPRPNPPVRQSSDPIDGCGEAWQRGTSALSRADARPVFLRTTYRRPSHISVAAAKSMRCRVREIPEQRGGQA